MTHAQNINKMVAYQKGSVVSKEIVKKPTGTITLFAFDKGQGLSEHAAPYDALVVIVDGVSEIIVSGVKHSVSAGELLLMPANAPHTLKAIEKFKMMLIMMKSK